MTSADLAYQSLLEVSAMLEDRMVSSVELTRLMLERIARYEPRLNAWITVLDQAALSVAAEADREIAAGRRLGRLHGIPFGLKDLFDTAGVATTAGSPLLKGNVPQHDSTVAARLKAAGMVLLGKNNMLEFAYGYPHPDFRSTANPWDVSRTASGSSGGSAAAVAAGTAYLSMGTDTAGSIRIPASWNGLIGLKPTYGRVSLLGVVPLGYTLDTPGPLVRTAADAAVVLAAIAGFDPRDPASSPEPVTDYLSEMGRVPASVRIGIDRQACADDVHPEVLVAFEAAIDTLRDSGAEIVPICLPDSDPIARAAMTCVGVEAAHFHRRRLEEHPEGFSSAVRLRLERGRGVSGTEYVDAQLTRQRARAEYMALLAGVDALLTPTTVIPAMGINEIVAEANLPPKDPMNRRTRFTSPINAIGLPAVSAPAGWSSGQVPLGVQLVGAPFSEGLLLALADRVGAAQRGWERRPHLDVATASESPPGNRRPDSL